MAQALAPEPALGPVLAPAVVPEETPMEEESAHINDAPSERAVFIELEPAPTRTCIAEPDTTARARTRAFSRPPIDFVRTSAELPPRKSRAGAAAASAAARGCPIAAAAAAAATGKTRKRK